MTEVTNTNYIQAELNIQLNAVDDAVKTNRFDEATRLLQKARQTAGSIAELRQQVEDKANEIVNIRQSRIATLLAEAQRLLADEQAFDEGQIGGLLDTVQAIDSENKGVQRLRDALADRASLLREQRIYQETRKRCQTQWQQEQQMVEASVPTNEILDRCFLKALEVAEQALDKYPNSVLLKGLKAEAEREYNQARTRYEVKSTADATGDYESLIAELRKEKDPNRLIPWQDATGEQLSPITVTEARREAERLAEDFAYRKATEYLEQAQKHMEVHAPRAARDALAKRDNLFLLDQETSARLEYYLTNTVEPELRQLEEAERILQRAGQADSPVQGWQLIEQAVEAYVWIPGVDVMRQALLPRMANEATRLLNKAQQALDNDQVADAGSPAREARSLAERVSNYSGRYQMTELQKRGQALLDRANNLIARYEAEEQLISTLLKAAEDIESLLSSNPGAAMRSWQELVEEHGADTVDRFPRLRRLRRDVEAHSGVSSLLARLEGTFTSNDRERIEGALEDCRSVLGTPEYADFQAQLLAMQERLQLRYDYLLGLELLRAMGDADAALSLFDRVSGHPAHPDGTAAKEEAERIRGNKELAQRIDDVLETASESLADDPRWVYKALAPFAQISTRRKKEIQTWLSRARQAWQEQLVTEIKNEVARSALTEGRAQRLRHLAVEVQAELPEPRPVALAEQALAAAAAVEAQLHQTAREWEQATQKWQEALVHDRLNPEYKLNWQAARRQWAEIQLDQAEGDEEARGIFDQLELAIPLDPNVRERRARYYVRRAESPDVSTERQVSYYAAAREALTAAIEIVERPGNAADKALSGRLQDLEKTIIAGEKLSRAKAGIERKMHLSGSLAEFTKARQEANKLLSENRDDVTLMDWWQKHSAKVVEDLEQTAEALADNSLWDRFDLHSKILVLNPDHTLAQQLLRLLPKLSGDVSQEIDSLLQDRHQGLLVKANNELAVIAAQEQQAVTKLEQARAIYDMLQGFKDQVADPTVPGLLAILRDKMESLQSFLEELGSLRQLQAQALNYMTQARIDGEWHNFEGIIQRMNAKGFNNHRTTQALRRERDRLQERRKHLKAQRQSLLEALAAERFVDARQVIDVLENDPELGDPYDEFGLRATIRVTDPVDGEVITNWRVLKKWLQERLAQIENLAGWLVGAGTVDLLAANDLPYAQLLPTAPRRIAVWPEVKVEITALVNRGRFSEARSRLQMALEGNSGWYEANERVLPLVVAARWLAEPPIQPSQALSATAARLLRIGQKQHDEVIRPQLDEARETESWLLNRRHAWQNAYEELRHALAELDALYQKGWFWRRREQNKKQIIEATARVRAALLKCQAIAPEHPSLNDIEKHPLLRQ